MKNFNNNFVYMKGSVPEDDPNLFRAVCDLSDNFSVVPDDDDVVFAEPVDFAVVEQQINRHGWKVRVLTMPKNMVLAYPGIFSVHTFSNVKCSSEVHSLFREYVKSRFKRVDETSIGGTVRAL